jgi:hypothetical protein
MPTLDLLYAEPKSIPALRKQPGWPARSTGTALPLLGIAGLEGPDENDVATLLRTGAPATPTEISKAIDAGVRLDGRFNAPIVVVAGELRLLFDAVETLKLNVTTAIPFAGGDDDLKSAIDAAKSFLESAGELGAPSVAESMSTRIRDCFGRVRRAVAADYLEREVHRALVEQRRYRMGKYAGSPHARGLLAASDKSTLLCFIPKAALSYLPLSSKLELRMLAEAAPLSDQFESQPFALRLVACARIVQA